MMTTNGHKPNTHKWQIPNTTQQHRKSSEQVEGAQLNMIHCLVSLLSQAYFSSHGLLIIEEYSPQYKNNSIICLHLPFIFIYSILCKHINGWSPRQETGVTK